MEPVTFSLIVAWAVVRAMSECGWFGYQAVTQIPARRRHAIDVGYDQSPDAPETKPFTWARVFRRRAEGRHLAATVWAIGALAKALLSIPGVPFIAARRLRAGWDAGWREQKRRIDEHQEWVDWWREWWRWWMERPPPDPRSSRADDDEIIVEFIRTRRPDPASDPLPPLTRPRAAPRLVIPPAVAITDPASPAAEPRTPGPDHTLDRDWPTPAVPDLRGLPPGRDRGQPIALPERDPSSPTPALPAPGLTPVAVIDRPALPTDQGDSMSGDVATRTNAATTATRGTDSDVATRGGESAAPAPVAVNHQQAKSIGQAIVKRIASRLDEIADLKAGINADMTWIANQINDLEAAGIGGDLVSTWLNALYDGDQVHATAVTLSGQIVGMHSSARSALSAQATAGDTMADAKEKVGEQNVANSTDYY